MQLINNLDDLVREIKSLETIKEVSFNTQLDYIAYKEYGNESMFYIIAIYNNIVQNLNPDNRDLLIPDPIKASLIHANNSIFGIGGNQTNDQLTNFITGRTK